MRNLEEFMRQLFQTRIAEEKKILSDREPYRKNFFTPDCFWDSRRFTLEMIESERIVSVEDSDSKPKVVTEFTVSFSSNSARTTRQRYHLKIEANRFLICAVETLCPYCHGHGDESCLVCKGKHWM